jgi:hypothetical protein
MVSSCLFVRMITLGTGDCTCNLSSVGRFCYMSLIMLLKWMMDAGLTVNDCQMLVAPFCGISGSLFPASGKHVSRNIRCCLFHVASIPASDRIAWKEILYETTAQWTWLDYICFFFYLHLLHVVLLLVFATGTLQYDVLHLGYLAISFIFFRMQGTIMEHRTPSSFFASL